MTPTTDVRDGAAAEVDAGDETERFVGFERPDGRIGVRNRLLILPSVICSHIVADRIADEIPAAVSAPHDHGCAQLGADNEQTERTFLGVGTNPNVAGVVVVGLGCEEIQSGDVAAQFSELGVPVRELAIQSEGGSDRTIERGVDEASELLEELRENETTGTLADVTVGIVSSDVQESTVDYADPLIGDFARRVSEAGGRVLVAGTERLLPHADEALANAATESVEDRLATLLEERKRIPTRTTGLRQRAARRSYDEISRSWGGLPIRDVVEYGASATHDSGIAVVDAPSQFAEAATGLAAAGAHVIVHATAEGIPAGHPVVPVLKVTGDQTTYTALEGDIDVDATAASTSAFADAVTEVLGGEPSRAERHGLTEFAITRVGPSM
ncbi:MAG: UxaA family hydrolase [Natronomonas sp.]|uniref:UxaA family hydrolase n=1 Tax=Natronomonas sp. TaxID=2184060 RepID=UPI0028709BC4|nr:UxaA family hydrolase [Natronomonas sp.]MDR9429415.1 UxaA family hydrolase [Natronomonas sp.]